LQHLLPHIITVKVKFSASLWKCCLCYCFFFFNQYNHCCPQVQLSRGSRL